MADRYTAQKMKFSINPIDTGRKLNVHKTFRRRPGCLLNVLCTFNLRPVSTRKDFSNKCNQIRSFLWILSHLPKKSLMEDFVFCAVLGVCNQQSLPL